MRTIHSITTMILLILYPLITIAQRDSISYKYSKITLSSGEMIKVKNITISNDNVLYLKNNPATGQKERINYTLHDIQNIEVASKRNTLFGLIAGTGVGIITMIVVENQVEKPKSKVTIIPGPGYTITTTVTETKIMAPGPKIAIVAGGTLVGTIVGKSIKKGWKTIFPKNTTMIDNFDFNLAINPNKKYSSSLELLYSF